MKLEEAIEIVTEYMETTHEVDAYSFDDALQLLIEAGKRCLLARKETSFVGPGLLPGGDRGIRKEVEL